MDLNRGFCYKWLPNAPHRSSRYYAHIRNGSPFRVAIAAHRHCNGFFVSRQRYSFRRVRRSWSREICGVYTCSGDDWLLGGPGSICRRAGDVNRRFHADWSGLHHDCDAWSNLHGPLAPRFRRNKRRCGVRANTVPPCIRTVVGWLRQIFSFVDATGRTSQALVQNSLLREKNREFFPARKVRTREPHEHRRFVIAQGINREITGDRSDVPPGQLPISRIAASRQLILFDYHIYSATTKRQGVSTHFRVPIREHSRRSSRAARRPR